MHSDSFVLPPPLLADVTRKSIIIGKEMHYIIPRTGAFSIFFCRGTCRAGVDLCYLPELDNCSFKIVEIRIDIAIF